MTQKIEIKKEIEEKGLTYKFGGVAPEGFILIHQNTLEDLKDFEIWKSWKNNLLTIKELDNKNFEQ
jgi:hypothetical protein